MCLEIYQKPAYSIVYYNRPILHSAVTLQYYYTSISHAYIIASMLRGTMHLKYNYTCIYMYI